MNLTLRAMNVAAGVISLLVLIVTLLFQPDIRGRKTLVEEVREIEAVSTHQTRSEEIRVNLLTAADSRLQRATVLVNCCLILSFVSFFAAVANVTYSIRARKRVSPNNPQ
jgi:hypothetical protein